MTVFYNHQPVNLSGIMSLFISVVAMKHPGRNSNYLMPRKGTENKSCLCNAGIKPTSSKKHVLTFSLCFQGI